MNLSDQIRTAITQSGVSVYRIAMETKVEEKALRRFLRGAGLSLPSIDRIAQHLGLNISRLGADDQ